MKLWIKRHRIASIFITVIVVILLWFGGAYTRRALVATVDHDVCRPRLLTFGLPAAYRPVVVRLLKESYNI